MNRYFLLKLLKLKNGILTFEGKKTTDQSQVSVLCSHICHSVNSKLNLSRKVSHKKRTNRETQNEPRLSVEVGATLASSPSPPATPRLLLALPLRRHLSVGVLRRGVGFPRWLCALQMISKSSAP